MLIFFKRNAMSVRSKGGHPVYKSSTERDGEKTLSLRRQWDTFLYSPTDQKKQWDTFYLHQQIMIKGQNLWCQNGRGKRWTTPTGCFWVLPFRRALFLIKISVDCCCNCCMLSILYDLTNITVLWIGEINRSWNGSSLYLCRISSFNCKNILHGLPGQSIIITNSSEAHLACGR